MVYTDCTRETFSLDVRKYLFSCYSAFSESNLAFEFKLYIKKKHTLDTKTAQINPQTHFFKIGLYFL